MRARTPAKTIKITTDIQFKNLFKLIDSYPEMSVKMMHKIGKRGVSDLKRHFLSRTGKLYLKYNGWKDKRGYYKVAGKVESPGALRFTSFPLNLFEHGRKLRKSKRKPSSRKPSKRTLKDRREPARKILKVRFAKFLSLMMQRYTDKAAGETIYKLAKEV
jgi:hypothetical protein